MGEEPVLFVVAAVALAAMIYVRLIVDRVSRDAERRVLDMAPNAWDAETEGDEAKELIGR